MRTTTLVFWAVIGLAMIVFSIGQPCYSVAATTASKTSHASLKIISSSAKSSPAMNGVAVRYSDKLNGRKTASGQRFSQDRLTAAHRTLPLGTKVRVTNVRSGQSVDVVINDRGPWHADRIIDLSAAAAAQIGMLKAGKALVKLEILSPSTAIKS
ncbi:MAG: septal ring lytic transglycosylase RlpA family protein [Proteobacteria bacterium]|nr:septal ring lytic transglycosylase RlpA family protein [Pseudomonadota bacterium]